MKKIVMLVASQGKNKELAQNLLETATRLGAEVREVDLVDLSLPLYTPKEQAKGEPENAGVLYDLVKGSDGLLIVAPEYNGGVPPVLNNAIAWLSVIKGSDWREAFNNKAVALATHSGSGGLHLFAALRSQLTYIGCHMVGRVIHTHYNRKLDQEEAEAVLGQLIRLA